MCDKENYGEKMYNFVEELFPICRSITGKGIEQTLNYIQKRIPIQINKVPSGTKVFDWKIPKEWNINDAYVMDMKGNKIIDFQQNNLHVVGYSTPIDKEVTLEELQEHLFSIENQPNAIPYITSYYKERWGFCLTHNQRIELKDEKYKVYIDSELKNGNLTYGELIIKGQSDEEVFLSTYVCHPSMANNELSGPAVTTQLVEWILQKPRKYTYRIVFIPETIGSITYLSKNYKEMKNNIIAGFNITCVGDDNSYSYVESRYGNTLTDKVILKILQQNDIEYDRYSFLQRGSDERQYCSPGIDLPVASLIRSLYGRYPEYHTSLDNLDFISPDGLQGAYDLLKQCLELIEYNENYRIKCFCEPQLGKRGLYPSLSTKESGKQVRDMMNFIAYSDGNNDLIDISNIIGVPIIKLYPIIEALRDCDLI